MEFAQREGVGKVAPSDFGDFLQGVAGRLAPATTMQKPPKSLGLPAGDRRHFLLLSCSALALGLMPKVPFFALLMPARPNEKK